MDVLRGIAAAPGIAFGKVFKLERQRVQVEKRTASPDVEASRLAAAIDAVRRSVVQMRDELAANPEEAAIFEAHLMMLDDPDLTALVKTNLQFGAAFAWEKAFRHFAAQMDALPDEYFRARAADIRDVGRQVLDALAGSGEGSLADLPEPVIVFAQDLAPSDTGRMNKSGVLGFVTAEGSATSHVAILAKALGIPAVVGIGEDLEKVTGGVPVILDGTSGIVVLQPDEAALDRFREKQRREQADSLNSMAHAHQPAVTVDGHKVDVMANTGSPDDARSAVSRGAEGIGLLRTEFLYMNRHTPPDEDDQTEAYRAIFGMMGGRPVIIRTLDIGGDKTPNYMDLGKEANPFLGWRAIRVCLDQPDFFKTQLRAILRAAEGFDVRIMFPMIATLEELHRARVLLAEARSETGIARSIPVGIMVEIPSVVQMSDWFAREVDFFSIGTNDLTQYTFAIDRTNPKVASLATARHPAIYRQIARVIETAHARGIKVGVCGELAGDPEAIPVLLGLGLDEFSMSPGSIPRAKQIIRRWSFVDAQAAARQALGAEQA